MRTLTLGLVAFVCACAVTARAESGCSLKGFDSADPKHVADTAGLGAEINFQWASDADPRYNDRWKAWHYVKNLSDRRLSLNWELTGLLIAFGKPLPKDGVACSFSYTDSGGYHVVEAPIKVSSGESVGAEAYVAKPSKVSSRGGEIRTQYTSSEGLVTDAYASVFVTYYPEVVLFQVETSENVRVAFNPSDIGINIETFAQVAAQQSMSFGDPFELSDVEATKEELNDTFLSRAKGAFYSISSPGAKFEFPRSTGIAAETQILLLTENRELIAATKLMLNGAL